MSDFEQHVVGEISAVVTRADGTVEDLGVLVSLAKCPTCDAQMHDYELEEHRTHCAVIELAAEVEALTE